ncbi:hypothetical protein [Plantibacter flavus]|jgi:hypothetical protein|uniref:hypothetical protein n=1 Tax=Plantibacter TaxID=190323 RepID=UPI0023785070|nr:hypothetical protein [Plantibacter flavus]MDD9151576.1 hypothetical protein [Plantibacter flavus]
MRRTMLGLIGIVLACALAGCGSLQIRPDYDTTKSEALSLRAEFEATLPADSASTGVEDDVDIQCTGGAAQFNGILTVSVAADFDRAAWLDDAAAMYAGRAGWKMEKKVAADGSSDATRAVAFTSDDGFYLRLGEFADAPEVGPVIVLSASGPCSVR